MTRILEGTGAEIAKLLDEAFSSQHLRVYIDDDASVSEVPSPPTSIRNRVQLEELLRQGYEGQPHSVTEDIWEQLHARIESHVAKKQL